MIIQVCLWRMDVFIFPKGGEKISHEYFMRNKRKYLLINSGVYVE